MAISFFTKGNAGDLVTKDIVRHQYGAGVYNISSGGKRLLLVGSVSHRVQDGDVLCGIGTQGKAEAIPKRKDITICGLRGPISYEEFRAKGYELSQVKFLLDPGLMVRFLFQDETVKPDTGVVGFIPHYKERAKFKKLPRNVRFIDIDDLPANVCRHILSVEHVFSSSLHGVIFAHALGRPATLIVPETESLLKYKDYYASVGLEFPKPREFAGDLMKGIKTSPEHIYYSEKDFAFPSMDFLREKQILRE